MVISHICYNHGLKQYLVVLTGGPGRKAQVTKWFSTHENDKWWIDQMREQGLHPTFIFYDINLNKLLHVMTEDNDRNDYLIRSGLEIEK